MSNWKQVDNSSTLSAQAKVFQQRCDYGTFLLKQHVTGPQRSIYHHGYKWLQNIYLSEGTSELDQACMTLLAIP
jgi:hypothetical protein